MGWQWRFLSGPSSDDNSSSNDNFVSLRLCTSLRHECSLHCFGFCSVVRMSLCQNRCHLADTDPPWYSIYGGFLPAKDASLKMSLACCGSVLLKSHAVAEYNWRFFAMADPCSSWLHILSLMVTSSQILREAVKMGQAWESSVSDRWSGCFWVFADFPVVCLGVGEERNLCSMRC